MELIFEKIAERQAELSVLPENVRTWIMFMRLWFFSGILFAFWWKPARWIVVTMVATAVAIIASKILLPDFDTIKAGTIIQLGLWIPLAIYLIKNWTTTIKPALKSKKPFHMLFGLWAIVATTLVMISSILNIYNVSKWLI